MANQILGLTEQQLRENTGQFIHEYLYLSEIKSLVSRIETLEGRPAIPTAPSGTATATKATVTWTAPNADAKAYVVHYGPVGNSNPHAAVFMGYSVTTSFDLDKADYPVGAVAGDQIYFWVQAFNRVGTGSTDIEKAAELNENAWGSEWAGPVVVTLK